MERKAITVAPNAEVDPHATIGAGTAVWGLACVRENAIVGRDCVIGRGAYVEDGVVIGDRVKIQTNALIFKPARIGDDVFLGPAVILSNDRYPRASTPEGDLKRAGDWQADGVVVERGASIGARAVVLPGVHIGRFAMIAAGAIVTRDVEDFAIMMGGPARRTGWVGRAGVPLVPLESGRWLCPATEIAFREEDGVLVEELSR